MGRWIDVFARVHRAAERAYVRAPDWMQTAICNIEGARIQLERYPKRFEWELQQSIARTRWPREGFEAARLERLRTMLTHAGRHVPYWRDLFADISFRPESIDSVEDLQRLPVLTKDIVIAQGDRMLADHVPACHEAGRPTRMKTSGSTGAGLSFVTSQSALLAQWAACWRFRSWHGIERGTWSAQLTGRVVVPVQQSDGSLYRVNHAGKQLLLSGYHLTPDTAVEYLKEIARRHIEWLHGYPSLVVLLADAAASSGLVPPQLRWISLASENVTADQRIRIERGFGIAPIQHYAQTEAVANASEGPDGVMRLDDDFSIVELADDPEITCRKRIYGTSLDNWHQPFIRYDTGDLAEPDLEEVANDWVAPGRALRSIDGRREDYIELANGALVGRTDHIFKSLPFIRQAQIRQSVAGQIRIAVVPRDGEWTEDRQSRLRREAAARLGDTRVDIDIVDEIARGPNGKLRLVVREKERRTG